MATSGLPDAQYVVAASVLSGMARAARRRASGSVGHTLASTEVRTLGRVEAVAWFDASVGDRFHAANVGDGEHNEFAVRVSAAQGFHIASVVLRLAVGLADGTRPDAEPFALAGGARQLAASQLAHLVHGVPQAVAVALAAHRVVGILQRARNVARSVEGPHAVFRIVGAFSLGSKVLAVLLALEVRRVPVALACRVAERRSGDGFGADLDDASLVRKEPLAAKVVVA